MNYTQGIRQQIIELNAAGMSSRNIADILGVSKSGVNEYLAKVLGNGGPKVLFFDLETAPDIVATFGRWNVNIGQQNLLQEGNWLLSASWSWLGQDKIDGYVIKPTEAKRANDFQVVARMLEVYNKADIVVAHNAQGFDVPIFRTRLLMNGMAPPKHVRVIDTLRMAKKLKFGSNKLDSLSQTIGFGEKIKHAGIQLWVDCLKGDKDALQKMLDYNKQDVKLLKDAYYEMAPFDPSTPNFAAYYDDENQRCSTCGSTELVFTGNKVLTNLSIFSELRCTHCGTISRTRTNEFTKGKRQSLIAKV